MFSFFKLIDTVKFENARFSSLVHPLTIVNNFIESSSKFGAKEFSPFIIQTVTLFNEVNFEHLTSMS